MPDREACDVVIIGAGSAGLTAALYAQRYALHSVILERESAQGGQIIAAGLIENYPGFPDGIVGLELSQRFTEHALKFGARIVNAAAEALRREDDLWVVQTAQGEWVAPCVIIAGGAGHRHLKIPGERDLAGKGVSYCATCDGFFFQKQHTAVVGGGNVAIEDALFLADICERVTVIHRRDELRAHPILQKRALARENIEFAWNCVPVTINGRDRVESVTVRDVQTEEERTIPVSGVFVAIGFEPRTQYLEGIVEMNAGHIVTDQAMRTSAPGIFACGDVRDTPLKQITTAVGDGSVAADSAYRYLSERRGQVG